MEKIFEMLLLKAGLPVVFFILGILAARFIKPWINKSDARLKTAQEIALIADRITDEMRLLLPNQPWTEWIDSAVDKLISACDLTGGEGRIIAHREISAQIMKKISGGNASL